MLLLLMTRLSNHELVLGKLFASLLDVFVMLATAAPIEVEWDGPQPALAWGWMKPQGKALLTQWRTTPVAVDWNKDGLMDLVMLDQEGYLAFFERAKVDDKLEKLSLGQQGIAMEAKAAVEAGRFTVEGVETKPVKRNPAPPFTTSTLQQEAARKLGYSAQHTMRLAQSLYEAGAITYMRTDGVQMDGSAISAARS